MIPIFQWFSQHWWWWWWCRKAMNLVDQPLIVCISWYNEVPTACILNSQLLYNSYLIQDFCITDINIGQIWTFVPRADIGVPVNMRCNTDFSLYHVCLNMQWIHSCNKILRFHVLQRGYNGYYHKQSVEIMFSYLTESFASKKATQNGFIYR